MKIFAIILTLLFMSCGNSSEKKEFGSSSKMIPSMQNPDLKLSMERGEMVYSDFCIQCHLANGKGVSNTFPPLAQSDWLVNKRTESIHAVKYGQKGAIKVNEITYNGLMPPMGLSDQEVADVMNYIMNSWGNTQENLVTPEEVTSVEK